MGDLKIENLQSIPVSNNGKAKQKDSPEFSEVMKGAINNVDKMEREANRSIMGLLQGKADVNETMLAIQKADISMRLFLTIRNKVIDAYREIMRMQF